MGVKNGAPTTCPCAQHSTLIAPQLDWRGRKKKGGAREREREKKTLNGLDFWWHGEHRCEERGVFTRKSATGVSVEDEPSPTDSQATCFMDLFGAAVCALRGKQKGAGTTHEISWSHSHSITRRRIISSAYCLPYPVLMKAS